MDLRVVRATSVALIAAAVACSSAKQAPPSPTQAASPAPAPVTSLSPSDIDATRFGKLFERAVDGLIVAQPVYAPAVPMPDGATHNAVLVATEHNSVFAFDADDPALAAPLWKVSFGQAPVLPNPWFGNSPTPATCKQRGADLRETGITSTPALDPATGTLYVTSFVEDDRVSIPGRKCIDIDKTHLTWCLPYDCSSPGFRIDLHAIDVRTGKDRPGSPVTLQAQVPGAGIGSINGVIPFQPELQLQRAGLLLSHGKVYIAFGSYGDFGNYHGWLLAYDATTLAQVAAWNDTPDGGGGGIWQSGRSPVADADGNVYVITGNGSFNAQIGGHDYSDSFVKLDETLHVLDWFAPYQNDFNGKNLFQAWDADLGSAGPVLVPGTNLVIGGGKTGVMYVLSQAHLGNFDSDNDDVLQSFTATWRFNKTGCSDGVDPSAIFGTPALWDAPDGPRVYVWGLGDYLRAYRLTNGQFATQSASCFCPASSSQPADPLCGAPDQQGTSWSNSPGAFLTLSTNPTTSTAIVWATHPTNEGASTSGITGVIEAYDANDITKPLWTSDMNPDRDAPGNAARLTPPMFAGTKVYAATASKKLVVYGPLPQAQPN
jgi:hypothetical protein